MQVECCRYEPIIPVCGRFTATPAVRRITIGDLLDELKAKFELDGQASPQDLSRLRKVSAMHIAKQSNTAKVHRKSKSRRHEICVYGPRAGRKSPVHFFFLRTRTVCAQTVFPKKKGFRVGDRKPFVSFIIGCGGLQPSELFSPAL